VATKIQWLILIFGDDHGALGERPFICVDASLEGKLIPKVIHRIWFGNASMPMAYENYWAAWQRQLPDYKFCTWRDSDIISLVASKKKIMEAEGMARKADIARYEILFNHGGIYLDCDIMPLQYFNMDISGSELIVCNEDQADDHCSNSFIASPVRHAALEWALCELNSRPLNLTPPPSDTGPKFFRQALARGVFKTVPTATFYPFNWNEPFSAILERDISKSVGVHVWSSSWYNETQMQNKAMRRLQQGDLEEVEKILKEYDATAVAAIRDACQSERAARIASLTIASMRCMASPTDISNKSFFEFLKVGLYLLSKDPSSLVWQIGAADGILVDPLRPLLVNFDMPSVLVEPNPYLFELLTKNYAANKNAKLVNAAFNLNSGTLMLNAVNPTKSREKELPDWVQGISSIYTDRNPIESLKADEKTARAFNDCLEVIEVKVVNVDNLLRLNEGRHPKIVVIDAEGMDFIAVETIFRSGLRPLILYFERRWLLAHERILLNELLLTDEYITIRFGVDAVAYRKDLFFSYCEHLYVENGISTIYSHAFGVAVSL
jgi:FkbM family methyltransferase